MDIRQGLIPFDVIMADVNKRLAVFEELSKTSTLPWGVNHNQTEKLYRELQEMQGAKA